MPGLFFVSIGKHTQTHCAPLDNLSEYLMFTTVASLLVLAMAASSAVRPMCLRSVVRMGRDHYRIHIVDPFVEDVRIDWVHRDHLRFFVDDPHFPRCPKDGNVHRLLPQGIAQV